MYCAAEGDVVTYNITLTNPTIDTPMTYDLYDDLFGGYIDSGTLAAGASHTYKLRYTVPAIPADPSQFELYNLAYVNAWDPQKHSVYASDKTNVAMFVVSVSYFVRVRIAGTSSQLTGSNVAVAAADRLLSSRLHLARHLVET